MGTLTTQPYSVEEGREYADYLDRLLGECRRLMKEGRLPGDQGVVAFLDDAQVVAHHVRRDVTSAEASGQRTTRSEVPMTKDEYRRMRAMSESLRNLLEILELREAVVLNRTEAVGRVAAAVQEGEFAE